MSTEENVITRNAPKIGFAPGSFEIQSLVMTNSGGATRDIRKLLESFSITEEIYSPVVTFTGVFRDDKNFFNNFSITGQEILDVKLSKVPSTKAKGSTANQVSLKFYVKEYPNYTRTLDFPSVQTYTVIAISDFAYISSLKKISKSIKGNVAKNIQDVFSTDLYREVIVRGRCTSEFDGIITIQPPLKALDWLRRRAFDGDGSPFFLYSTISEPTGKITLASWKEISNGGVQFNYVYKQRLESDPDTQEAYDEELSRILDMRSTIGLDKLAMSNRGSYSNKTYITDYAMKTYTDKEFTLKKKSFASLEYSINGTGGKGVSLYETYDASQSFIQINTASADNALPNSTTGPVQDNINSAKSFFALMNESSHNITVYGDFRLNPGSKIKLKIPRAIRREANETEPEEDELLSGEYIIVVAAHRFAGGVYTSQLKLVKNNLPKK